MDEQSCRRTRRRRYFVPEGARLDPGQQLLVERHQGMVPAHVQTFARGPSRPTRTREREDLHQEGYLALIKAASMYQPERDGPFPAFASDRIRTAVYLALQHKFCLVHVSMRARRDVRLGRREPGLPKLVDVPLDDRLPQTHVSQGGAGQQETIGEYLRSRYLAALDWAVSQRPRRRWREGDPAVLATRVVGERLAVPREEWRTPVRTLARELNIPASRVRFYEARLLTAALSRLRDDPQTAVLNRLADEDDLGTQGVINESRRALLDDAEATAFDQRFAGMAPAQQAQTLYLLIQRGPGDLCQIAGSLFRMTRRPNEDALVA